MLAEDPDHVLHHPRHVRSNGYDPAWVIENQMGPHALWLLESLLEEMTIEPGMTVLDLGCGRAMTSLFLAHELGARVWATDLWIPAEENEARIRSAGLEHLVTAVHAEAHALPFERGTFDAIVSLDAYHYFGTADLYIGYITEFLSDGGQLGIVVPSMLQEPAEVPAHLRPYWDWEFCSFHSPDWWRRHWSKTGKVEIAVADALEDGWRDWLRFNDLTATHLPAGDWRVDASQSAHEMLVADRGRHLGFARVVATKC